jgi:hypothetical protein
LSFENEAGVAINETTSSGARFGDFSPFWRFLSLYGNHGNLYGENHHLAIFGFGPFLFSKIVSTYSKN